MSPQGPLNERISVLRDQKSAFALFAPLAGLDTEVCAFAFLDPEWRILGTRFSASISPDRVAVPFREIARDVLAFDACAVVMAHNHPGGDTKPSRADIDVTRRLAHMLQLIDTRLVDHLIVTRNGTASMRAAAML
jgi:DNA repair protein RadC